MPTGQGSVASRAGPVSSIWRRARGPSRCLLCRPFFCSRPLFLPVSAAARRQGRGHLFRGDGAGCSCRFSPRSCSVGIGIRSLAPPGRQLPGGRDRAVQVAITKRSTESVVCCPVAAAVRGHGTGRGGAERGRNQPNKRSRYRILGARWGSDGGPKGTDPPPVETGTEAQN